MDGPFRSESLDVDHQGDFVIMASEKRRRKQSSIDRRLKHPVNPTRPKDGDRRHKGSDTARLEQERKQAAQRWNLDVGWTDESEGSK